MFTFYNKNSYKIFYKIKPRTPKHNNKIERSHRNKNEQFYTYLKFNSLDSLRKQLILVLQVKYIPFIPFMNMN